MRIFLNKEITKSVSNALANQINNLLPQTQCTKCGYPACHLYAEAIANGTAEYNQCPPGGTEGISRLAILLNKPIIPLNTTHGNERPRPIAFIDENLCIGCTLCIQACPVDAIMGAAKHMHTVISQACTGCDLCVAPCPVDCIYMIVGKDTNTGWAAWSPQQANDAKKRFETRQLRLVREQQENEARLLAKAHEKFRLIADEPTATQAEMEEKERKKRIIAAAIERANAKKTPQQPQ